ncbi:hypothetical protein GC177_05820 [bacterium]|nr:hypothetical protein [bacterium]
MSHQSQVDQFAESFRPQNPYASAMHKTLADFGVPAIDPHTYMQAGLLVSDISYRMQMRMLTSKDPFNDTCTVFLREVRQVSDNEFWFLVEQSLDGTPVVFSSAFVAEIYDGIPPQRFTNPSMQLSLSGLSAWTAKLGLTLSTRIAQFTGTPVHTIPEFIDHLRPLAAEKYQRLLNMLHVLLYLSMDDGFLFESERKVIRSLIQKGLGKNSRDLFAFTRYADNAYVTVPAFKHSMAALLPMSAQEAHFLIETTKALVASDGVFSESEEIFIQQLRNLLEGVPSQAVHA